jgi:hypothetical protein
VLLTAPEHIVRDDIVALIGHSSDGVVHARHQALKHWPGENGGRGMSFILSSLEGETIRGSEHTRGGHLNELVHGDVEEWLCGDHSDDFDLYRHLSACHTCALRPQCSPTKLRRIKRWKNEAVREKMQARLDQMPDALKIPRQTVEHPFATLKAWMGASHFLTRTLQKVRTQVSLHVLAYNIKRMIKISGVIPLMEAIRT